MNNFLLLILTMFIYNCCYNFTNLERTDRDDALRIAGERFVQGKNPYDTLTAIGNPLTTGTSSILYASILDERNLSFLFWLWIVAIFYNGRHFTLYALMMIVLFPLFARTMIYRLEELYFGLIPTYYAFKRL